MELVQELVDNCGISIIDHFVYRSRLNLKPDEMEHSVFDSPSFKTQKIWRNRFQPLSINCLYAAGSESTAVLEILPAIAEVDDVIYVAELKIEKSLRVLDLVNNIKFMSGGKKEWDYKPVMAPMFFNEDPTAETKTIESTRMISQLVSDRGLDGIRYTSRCDHLSNLKRGKISVDFNYVIYGSPIEDGRISFNPRLVKKYRLNQFVTP